MSPLVLQVRNLFVSLRLTVVLLALSIVLVRYALQASPLAFRLRI